MIFILVYFAACPLHLLTTRALMQHASFIGTPSAVEMAVVSTATITAGVLAVTTCLRHVHQ